jgi:hypothetical protein
MEELKTIELFIDSEKETDEVYAISLVETPAIEEDFVALSKEEVMLKSIDDEKRIVVGLALVPDKKILRKGKEGYYNIILSKETVREASEIFLKRMYTNNATLEHQEKTDGVSFVESWIVENPDMDKINLYGIKAPEGAWAVVGKVESDEVWKDVKEGKYYGFSIEGIFSNREAETEVDLYKEKVEEIKKLLGL